MIFVTWFILLILLAAIAPFAVWLLLRRAGRRRPRGFDVLPVEDGGRR